jgi:hypothetical protein
MLWVIRARRKPMLLVLRATRKLLIWYLEQSVNSSYRIMSNKKINAKSNHSNNEIQAPVSGTNIFGNFGFSEQT